jgi:hypothetical protein
MTNESPPSKPPGPASALPGWPDVEDLSWKGGDALSAQLKRAREWMRHKDYCNAFEHEPEWPTISHPCTCGLTAFIEEVGEI